MAVNRRALLGGYLNAHQREGVAMHGEAACPSHKHVAPGLDMDPIGSPRGRFDEGGFFVWRVPGLRVAESKAVAISAGMAFTGLPVIRGIGSVENPVAAQMGDGDQVGQGAMSGQVGLLDELVSPTSTHKSLWKGRPLSMSRDRT